MPTRQWSFFVRSSPPLYFLLSLLSCSVAARPRREWMGIEPTRRRVNDASTALKAAGPTRRPDTPDHQSLSPSPQPPQPGQATCDSKSPTRFQPHNARTTFPPSHFLWITRQVIPVAKTLRPKTEESAMTAQCPYRSPNSQSPLAPMLRPANLARSVLLRGTSPKLRNEPTFKRHCRNRRKERHSSRISSQQPKPLHYPVSRSKCSKKSGNVLFTQVGSRISTPSIARPASAKLMAMRWSSYVAMRAGAGLAGG